MFPLTVPLNRRLLVPVLAVALTGCMPDFIQLPDWWPAFEEEPPAAVAPPVPTDDPAQNPQLAFSRFGFLLMAIGGVAGIVALQNKLQNNNAAAGTTLDTKQQDIGWPIAAFGFGLGLPIYVYGSIIAGQELDEAQKKKLSGRR